MTIDNGDYAMIMGQVALLNATIAGMQAENQQRLHLGQSVAYDEKAFDKVRETAETVIGWNAVYGLIR